MAHLDPFPPGIETRFGSQPPQQLDLFLARLLWHDDLEPHVLIAPAAARTRQSLALQAQDLPPLAFGRHAHLDRAALSHGKTDRPARPAMRLVERDRDLRLEVAAARGDRGAGAARPAPAEEHLEEVAESSGAAGRGEQVTEVAQVAGLPAEALL